MNENDGRMRYGREDNEGKGISGPLSLPPIPADTGPLSGKMLLAFSSWLEIWPDALVLIDAIGRIVLLNSLAETLLGYSRSTLIGQPLEILLPERFRAPHVLLREQYLASPHRRPMGAGLELYARHRNGTEFPVDISLSPMYIDDALYVLGAICDVTKRYHQETPHYAARHSTENCPVLLQTLFGALPTGIYVVSGPEARLLFANRAANALWGAEWSPGQPMLEFLISNHICLFDPNGQEMPPSAYAIVRALYEGKTISQQQEIIVRPDGTSLSGLVNAVVLDHCLLPDLELEGGAAHHFPPEPAVVVVTEDITALKQAEQLKDHFFGLVAHELRNPLASLKGFATMLLRYSVADKGTVLADWQREALTEIDLATNRLNRLTEDLLDVVRLQAGRLVLYPESVDLVTLTRRVMAQVGSNSEHHQFRFSTPLAHLQARVDGGRIEQVLANLLTNAMKYSPDGGPIEVTLRQVSLRQEAFISVKDHGIGIPLTEQPHLFGRFVRASNSKALGIVGTGLGLYLCRELIERHGGKIWFESKEGIGTTFFIRLPLHSAVNGGLGGV